MDEAKGIALSGAALSVKEMAGCFGKPVRELRQSARASTWRFRERPRAVLNEEEPLHARARMDAPIASAHHGSQRSLLKMCCNAFESVCMYGVWLLLGCW